MIKRFFFTIYLCLFALSTIGTYESKGLIAFEILRDKSYIFLFINVLICLLVFFKNKHFKNKFLIYTLAIGGIGSIINFINFLYVESTPFYFSIISILAFSLGLKYSNNKEINDSIHQSLLIFGLINCLVAISQILVGLFKYDESFLIYGVGLGPGDNPWAYLSRPTGLFANPFSLAVFGTLLIGLPRLKNTLIFRIVGTSLVFFSLSRAYIGLTFCHLIFWIIKRTGKQIFNKTSSLFIGLSVFVTQIYLLRLYLANTPSDSFTYKFNAIPLLISIFLNNPITFLFGFSKSNENEFFSLLDPNISFISDSYESWFLRLIIFGGLFLALAYLYPLARVFLLSIKNSNLLFCTSSLIVTSIASFASNGGFGGFVSWIYFYIIANIYVISNIKNNKSLPRKSLQNNKAK